MSEPASVVDLRPGPVEASQVVADVALMRATLVEARQRMALLKLFVTILGAAAYQWVTLLLVASGFAAYLVAPSWPRLVGVVAFSLLCHVHTYWRSAPKESAS